MKPLLEVSDLRTSFAGGVIKAVNGVSFDVREGETVAIVGESGSGKSVTAMSILRLIPTPGGEITGGKVVFDGQDLLALDDRRMQRVRGKDIAFIFQEPMSSLNPVLRIGSQIVEPAVIHRLKSGAKRLHDLCLGLLEKVRIPDPQRRISAYPHELSGGMRQRAMIAMALACEPRLIIADEPTTALDVTVQAQILELLRDLTRQSRCSMILITHDLGVVARYAQRVNIMYAGRIVESGSTRAIFRGSRHPYTLGLMASMPGLERRAGQRLQPIPGQPPDMARPPAGCPFSPRCSYAVERCHSEMPPLTSVAPDHNKACWVDVDA